MQLIAVDIGNSSIKFAIEHISSDRQGQSGSVDHRWTRQSVIREGQSIHLDLEPEPALWTVCSVNRPSLARLTDWIRNHRINDRVHVIDESEIELVTSIESREQTGRDRLVAAWMAVQLNDGKGPLIVVDAGTAVTVDWIDEQTVFQGGLIFPGAQSR